MKTIEEQGGYAFPTERCDEFGNYHEHGMTLRDWFAGMVIQGLLSNSNNTLTDAMINSLNDSNGDFLNQLTLVSYETADAMLEARGK